MKAQGSRCDDALADDVLQNIYNREALIERLENLHKHQSSNEPPRQNRVQRLLYGIHNASLSVVEAISVWNIGKQDDWRLRKNIEIHHHAASPLPLVGNDANEQVLSQDGVPCPFNVFLWNGQNYLQKMLSDLDFVGDITDAIAFLGSDISFHRNPFLLSLSIDDFEGLVAPSVKTFVWNDVNFQRARQAAFVLLLDEYNRNGGYRSSRLIPRDLINVSCLRRDAINSAKFHPPELGLKDLEVYTSMLDPPATVVVALCCAHLVLGTVDADVINKLIYLTKVIVLNIFRKSLSGLVRKARVHNPLRQPDGNAPVIKLVHPLVMHQNMNPDLIAGIPDQIRYLIMWLRALLTRIVDKEEGISSKTSAAADHIFHELEADSQRGDPPKEFDPQNNNGKLPDDSNKENECTSKNASVQTEELSPNKLKPDSSQRILKTIFGDANEQMHMVPFPVAITVDLKEGSRVASVNGDIHEAKSLEPGDGIRISDAHESSNWIIANSPSYEDNGSITFHLEEAYDHSLIVAHETEVKNDTLNRLCYPYKKDGGGNPVHKPPEAPSIYEDRIRHVASDAIESIHSPLHIKEARIWKLIPEEDDTRTTWRREYDDGAIHWESENAERNNTFTQFRVRVSLETIERSCTDSPYLLDRCVHQQRVNFFESVPLSDVIDEAFHNVCRWHSKGTLIDNVKWAKLARKMKFLSNVKNSKHEIDMSFVRHNRGRKLDLARFHAIFKDIATIQYPTQSQKDALSKFVWASVVMLPDVNIMMWKEAKRMAINVEAKRVCAQIRISARMRKNIKQTEYLKAKGAAIAIAKGVRQFLAHIFVSKLLRAMREDKEYQQRCRCAKVVQTAWRRFFWRNRFMQHQERRIEEKRQHIAATRAKLREMRERERASIIFREVICIDSTIATVTIYFRDESYLQNENSMLLKVYVPTTEEEFVFNLEENAIRECIEKALSSEGRLSWNEMLKENALKELTKRLMLRVVRGRPIFLFSRRNIVERGLLVDKRVVRAVGHLLILTTFRSPHNFVFYTYQPSTRLQMRTKLTLAKLREWLNETKQSSGACGRHAEKTEEDAVCLLDAKRQAELIEWLVKRVVVRKNPKGDNMQLLLQFEAEEERVIKLITKLQAQWRRLKSRRCAKDRTMHQYEKIYVREEDKFAYRNMLTDERQWDKPKLLGDDDLIDPVDEWRKEEATDPTGQKHQYYANYATGQSSWLTEEGAAILVQRRYRSKHESDLLGKKIQLPDIVKALNFIHGTRTKYEEEPHKLSHIVNYALLVHCLDLDFNKAKPIYQTALEQSPNHPLISRAYGIFLLASRQAPHATNFQLACRLFHEANVVDPTQAKFQSATEIYFRWAVLVDAKNPLALLNYALLHQCIYKKYDHAEKIYRAALALDPTNTFVLENYRLFTDERYPGGVFVSFGPPFSVVRRSQVIEERLEWAEWSKMSDPECPRKGMGIFWFNKFTKETRFHEREPNWKLVFETRMERSRCISGKTSNWVEYWDDRTQSSFFFDVLTKQYTCTK